MKLTFWASVLIVGIGMVFAACGSDGQPSEDDAYTGTVRSEREAREASVMKQQQSEPIQDQSQVQAEANNESAGLIDFGHREGLPFFRNSVGDPEAPVVIVEYSDFQ
jgi:hypothetical protein